MFAALSKGKKIWIWSLLILFSCIGLVLAARPAIRSIKHWRAQQFIEDAKIEESKEQLQTAFEKAYTAYQLYPNDNEIARYTAHIITRLSPTEALPFWINLAKETGSEDDLYATARLALSINKPSTAEEFLNKLKITEPLSTRTLLLEAQLQALKGHYEEAIAIAERLTQMPDVPSEAQLLYVKLSQRSAIASERLAGIEYLRSLAKQKNEDGLVAIRNLAAYSGNNKEDIKLLIKQIHENPLATSNDKLLALFLAQKINEADANTVLAKAEALFENASMEERVELGRWLNVQRAYTKTAHCISMQEAMTRYDLFLVWADAMAMTNQWKLLSMALHSPDVPLEEFLRHLFLARVAKAENQEARFRQEWSKAYFETNNNPDKLWFLIHYAIRLQYFDEAIQGLQILTNMPAQAKEAWTSWIDICLLKHNTKELTQVLKNMVEVYPRDSSVENDLRYAEALQGPLQDKALARAKNLVAENPTILAYRMTLALALLRENKPTEALKLLDGLDIPWMEARSGWRAVYAGILRENGRNALADLIINQLPEDYLLPEEVQLAHKVPK